MKNNSFIQWFIGLIDAEGNFQVFKKKRTDQHGNITRYGIGVGFHLGMSLRDLALIESIQKELEGIGNIYQYPNKNEVHYAITKKI